MCEPQNREFQSRKISCNKVSLFHACPRAYGYVNCDRYRYRQPGCAACANVAYVYGQCASGN